MVSQNAITGEVLESAKAKGNLEYAMKYAIDNTLKLDPELGTTNPIEYVLLKMI